MTDELKACELLPCPICNSPTKWCCDDACRYIVCTGLCGGIFDMSKNSGDPDTLEELQEKCAEIFNTRSSTSKGGDL